MYSTRAEGTISVSCGQTTRARQSEHVSDVAIRNAGEPDQEEQAYRSDVTERRHVGLASSTQAHTLDL